MTVAPFEPIEGKSMGLPSFLFRHSRIGHNLTLENLTLERKLADARLEIEALKSGLAMATQNLGQAAPASAELSAPLREALDRFLKMQPIPLPDLAALSSRLNLAAGRQDPLLAKLQPTQYLQLGMSAVDVLRKGVPGLSWRVPKRILCLDSGWGSVARWIAAAWPEAGVEVTDWDFPAVTFCLSHLGLKGFKLDADRPDFGLGTGYDLIWLGTTLGHLRETQVNTMLTAVARALAPGGHVCVASHGDYVAQRLRSPDTLYDLRREDADQLLTTFERTGFAFAEYPDRLGVGLSLMSDEWLRTTIMNHPTLHWRYHEPRGWDFHWDIVVCQRPSAASATA
jgi:SAM-dependent methyltransferase